MNKKDKTEMANKNIKDFHVPKAENMLKETEPNTLIKWVDLITKAKDSGNTYCYLCSDDGRVTRNAVIKILEAGYDLKYSFFKDEMTGQSLFIKAFWQEGCSGRLYDERSKEYVDVDTMFRRIMA